LYPHCIIFDLDGTLLDTLADLADSMNAALKKHGFPEHQLDAYRYFVGEGMDVLAARVLPESNRSQANIQMLVAEMKVEYSARRFEKTRPYDGICEVLEKLNSAGVSLAVLSNKNNDFTNDIVGHYFGSNTFRIVLGAGIFAKKPDPAGVLHILNTLQSKPSECLFVGDTGTDMKTARSAQVYAAGVLWGFREKQELITNGADVLISQPKEIIGLLKN
jgi:phosphoglycolate phosphatase